MAYVGTYPTTPSFSAVNFKVNSTTKETVSESGRRIRTSVAGTRFSATLKYPPIKVEDFMSVQAFIAKCQGPLNSFDLVMPTISHSRSGFLGTIEVDGNQSAGDSTITVTAYDTDSTVAESKTILKAGDVIRFASHTKVYMVTQDIVTDASGDATIDITPSLFEDIVTATQVQHLAVPFRVTLTNDLQEIKYSNNGFVAYEIDVLEEL